MVEGKRSQLHIEVGEEMMDDIRRVCPDKGMISLLIRKLLREFFKAVKKGDREAVDTAITEMTKGLKEGVENDAVERLVREAASRVE